MRVTGTWTRGKVGADAPVSISVVPATFKGKDGKVVVGVRVGRHFLVPEHVDAICNALGVTPDPDRYFALFS